MYSKYTFFVVVLFWTLYGTEWVTLLGGMILSGTHCNSAWLVITIDNTDQLMYTRKKLYYTTTFSQKHRFVYVWLQEQSD